MKISKSSFLLAAALASVSLYGTTYLISAQAAAPMQKVQAPGFYRMMLGDFEVTAISDGTVKLPMKDLLVGAPGPDLDAAFKLGGVSNPIETSVNTYLINTGTKLVLIDTGAAGLFGPTLGNFLANLKAAGYTPDQIDEVYITHMHGDHMGGLMAGDKMAFPNAVVRVDKDDLDFWLSEEKMKAAPKEAQGGFQAAQASFKAYVAAGKVKAIEKDGELVPGISAKATHGHTPGHSVFVVQSKNEKLVLWGDLMHVASVQFENPKVAIKFDSDNKAATDQREKAFADAAANGYLVGVTHISFPGIGYVRKNLGRPGYSWVPVNYSSGK
jgi:glyoxylase-like metal-dependent hydrolase (beta-lactamase superfamily II)